MGWREWLGLAPEKPADDTPVVLGDVLARYDLVDVVDNDGDPFVIVAEKGSKELKSVTKVDASHEIGSSSPSPFTGWMRREYNEELKGLKGLEKYDRMRKSDGEISGTLLTIKTPVLAGRWFIEPASDKKRDKNAAEFVWKCLTEYMSITWNQILVESLLCADFGYYMFEKVWEERVVDGQKRMIWQKLAPRHPMDVKEVKYDSHGGPKGVVMYVPNEQYGYDEKFIPIEKLLVFTHKREAGDLEGISVLRTAYKHWFFIEQLYKIDAIQKERHGIGIPVIKLPVGFSDGDKKAAEQLGQNLRTNERAHVVLPPNWDLYFAKIEGNPVDAMKSIEHHKAQIRANILASFLGAERPTSEEDIALFLKATRFIANIVCDTFNTYAIPQLIDYNFDRVGTPKLKVRRIGEQADWRTLSFAIRNLIGAGVIRPDDTLEAWIREEMDLPEADVETVRIVQTPQGGPQVPGTQPNAQPGTQTPDPLVSAGAQGQNTNKNQVGLPRQSPLPPVGLPKGNAGGDGSGGK